MTAPRRAAAHPTLLAVLIGGLVLAGAIALITVLGGANSSSGATNHRAAGGPAASTSAAPTSATPTSTITTAATSGAATSSTTTSSAAPAKTSAPVTKPATTKPTTKPATTKPAPAAARRSVTYVVKRGDTLNGIATWFHQHGYGDLYERNRHVIGKNPDLIFPGQRITISDGKMAVGR